MNVIRKDLGKLDKISADKIDEMLQTCENILVCAPCIKHRDAYKSILSGSDQYKKMLLVLKMRKTDSGYVADVPVLLDFGNDNTQGFAEKAIDVNNVLLYAVTPEIIDVAINGTEEIYIDENDEAYYEIEEYDEVYVLVGERRVYKGKKYRKEKEVNGVFFNEDDARKMGKVLEDYGVLNDIEYKNCTVEKFSIM